MEAPGFVTSHLGNPRGFPQHTPRNLSSLLIVSMEKLSSQTKPNSTVIISISFPVEQQQRQQPFLRPFVQDYPGEPVPEETLTNPIIPSTNQILYGWFTYINYFNHISEL